MIGAVERPVDAVSERVVPRRRRLLVAVAVVALLVSVPIGIVLWAGVHLSTNLTRVDGVFDELSHRPGVQPGAEGAVNVLVVATDRGLDAGTPGTGSSALTQEEARSDTLMLLHLDADRRAASVISIPRDTLVDVPGHGRDRVGSAFSLGGPRLGIESVENLTGVRIDHLAVIDWSRFGALVDAVGGVSVDLAAPARDPVSGVTWPAGWVVLDGADALAFIRQSAGLPRGDLDRIARQHAVLGAVMADALHQEMRKDPRLLYDFLDTLTERLAVDGSWSLPEMASLVVSMRDFRSAQISYLTMPVVAATPAAGTAFAPDQPASRDLWAAVAKDRVGAWVNSHPNSLTRPAVN